MSSIIASRSGSSAATSVARSSPSVAAVARASTPAVAAARKATASAGKLAAKKGARSLVAAAAASSTSTPTPTTANQTIVFVSAEVAPFSKTGGLGDVLLGLPKELAARGHRVITIAPR